MRDESLERRTGPRLRIGAGAAAAAAAAMLLLPACVRVEQTVILKEDGSGQIVEVIRVDDRLIQAAKAVPELASMADFLTEERVRARLPAYGEVTIASHSVTALHGRGVESRTVYAFRDINQIAIPALPNRGANWPAQRVRFRLGEPELYHEAWRNAYYVRIPLSIALDPAPEKIEPEPDPRSPAERESLRAMLPVVRTMLAGLSLSLQIEAFEPIGVSRTHVISRLTAEDFADDETLLRVLEWNRRADPGLTGPGRLIGEEYTVYISKPTTHTDFSAKPVGGRR